MKLCLINQISSSYSRLIILTVFLLFLSILGIAQTGTGPYYKFESFNDPVGFDTIVGGTEIQVLYGGLENLDEGVSTDIPIGFTFVYNLRPYTSFRVHADGFVTLDTDGWDYASYGGSPYNPNWLDRATSFDEPEHVIAALWDDFVINNPGGSIKYKLTGTAPNRILKIEFHDLQFYINLEGNLIYQVWIYENSNVIEFRYGDPTDTGDETAVWGDWSDTNGLSIGLNGDRAQDYFMSITPGDPPTYSFDVANNGIRSHADIYSGLVYRFTPIIRWQGGTTSSENDWFTKTNWEEDTIPSSFDHALIPGGLTNYPVISGSGAISENLYVETGGKLTVAGGGDLTVKGDLISDGAVTVSSASEVSTGSLIVEGNASGSGNVTFERYMDSDGTNTWHLISAPVVGQDVYDLVSEPANGIVVNGTLNKYGVGEYNEPIDDWTTYSTSITTGDSIFTIGQGYEILRNSSGLVSFTGTLNTGGVDISLAWSGADYGWNLIGNPYPSAIGAKVGATSAQNLLAVNAANLDPSYAGLYLWDPDIPGSYQVINNSGGNNYIQAGQGFFVRANTDEANFSITKAMQSHQPAVDFKSGTTPWPTIDLIAESNSDKSKTMVTFDSRMTTGLDVTYDAGMFNRNSDLALYSRLVEDNGVDFAIQCLPEDYNNLVVPLGLKAANGTEVTIYADLVNLPAGCEPYLEDRIAGKFISMENASSYTIVMDDRYGNLNALFLHTSKNTVTSTKIDEINEPYKVLSNTLNRYIRVISTDQRPSLARVFDISGRLVMEKEINYGNDNLIRIPGQTGVYVIHINNERHNFSQKVFWHK